MIGQEITFDGHRLNDLFFVGEVAVGLPGFSPTLESKVGDGSFVRGSRMEELTISVFLVVRPELSARDAQSELLSWLDVDGPRPLSLSDEDERYRMVMPQGAPSVGDSEWNDRITVTFVQPDPILWGREASVTVPSGGSVSFRVGGDHGTALKVSTDAAVRDATTLQWGVRLDNRDVMRVVIPTGEATGVSIDCGDRSCAVGGVVTAPTLASDWLIVSPGTHVLANDVGSGACVVSWAERWYR